MEIADLQVLPAGHPPSPYSFPVVTGDSAGEPVIGELPESLTLRAVGWLGTTVTSKGEVSPECIERLIEAYKSQKTISDGTRGWHDCEICTTKDERYPGGKIGPVIRWRDCELRLCGHGHHVIRLGDTAYMCPVLILHYVLDHGYQPPSEFLTAVAHGAFLTAHDLVPSGDTLDEWFAKRHHRESKDGEAS